MSHRPVKAALLQVHSIVGLAVALILTVVGLTGATMSFEDEIQASLNAGLMRVTPRASPMLTPDEVIARLQATPDLGKISAITMVSDASASVRVRFARNEDSSRPSSVYVDPYDARVLGAPSGEDFFATVRKLHRWLLLPGDGKGYGRIITGTTAICLLVMLVTGLVLRWPRRAGSVRTWLKPQLAAQGRAFQWSLHAVVGTWVMAIYLVLVPLRALVLFRVVQNGVTWLFARPKIEAASMPAKGAPRERAAPSTPVGLNLAWSVFLREQGSRFATAQLQLPVGGATAVRIRSWARNISHDGARDEYRIDTVTGRMMSAEIYEDKTLGERMLASMYDIHRGSILGWPGKLLFMLAAALMPLVHGDGRSVVFFTTKTATVQTVGPMAQTGRAAPACPLTPIPGDEASIPAAAARHLAKRVD